MTAEELITDHPYLDNNGPTYVYGVCEHPDRPRCHKGVEEHSTMIKADSPRGRRRIESTRPYRD